MSIAKDDLKKRIANDYVFHPPQPGQVARYQRIREKAKELADLIADECPISREQSVALTQLDVVVFNANAAIARHE